MGTLLGAIEAEKSFEIAPASLGYAFADGMGKAEPRFGDRSYGYLDASLLDVFGRLIAKPNLQEQQN